MEIKYRKVMTNNKVTISPNGDVKITMSENDRNYESDIVDYAEKLSEKIKDKISENLKLKVKVIDGNVSRIKVERKWSAKWSALVYAMEVR